MYPFLKATLQIVKAAIAILLHSFLNAIYNIFNDDHEEKLVSILLIKIDAQYLLRLFLVVPNTHSSFICSSQTA